MRSEISKLQDGVTQVLSLLDAIASGDVDRDAIRRIRQGNTVDSIVSSLGIDVGGAEGQINLQEKLLEIAGRGLDNDQEDADGQSIDSGSEVGRRARGASGGAASERRPTYTAESSRTPSHAEDTLPQIKLSRSPPSPFHTDLPHRTAPSNSTAASIPRDQSFYRPAVPVAADPAGFTSGNQKSPFPPCSSADSSGSTFSSPLAQSYALDTPWSSIIADSEVVDNLIDTYFSWEHPGYSTICMEPFLKDFKARRRRFCSEALVNAIMARCYQMMECAGTPVAEGLVEGLYRRAESLLSVERPALETQFPYIQTLTVLSTINIVAGKLEHAWELAQQSARLVIMDALNNTDNPTDEDYVVVRANTFCGTICLPWYVPSG